jgi:hypothetical protein
LTDALLEKQSPGDITKLYLRAKSQAMIEAQKQGKLPQQFKW